MNILQDEFGGDNDDRRREEAVIEEPVIEDHILDEDGSVASTPATIIDDVMSLPTPTASPPPLPVSTPTAVATPTMSSLPSSPALPRSPASSSVASVASIASTSSGPTQLPTMPTPQITATVLNAIPPPGSPAASVSAVAIRYSKYNTG